MAACSMSYTRCALVKPPPFVQCSLSARNAKKGCGHLRGRRVAPTIGMVAEVTVAPGTRDENDLLIVIHNETRIVHGSNETHPVKGDKS